MISYIAFNSWKFGENFIRGLGCELLLFSTMICMEKVHYYNNGMDLDFLHYAKVTVFFAYWYYKVDEREIDFLVEKIKRFLQ